MKAADWIVDFLISKGVTDVFGLPGAVVLELLYAMDRRKSELTPHLNYHEQGAAFAACGYAQATGKLGVAYATRGPGMTNMLTGMADAYYDSIPTMFFTAHNSRQKRPEMRVENNQEIDTVAIAASVTKYAVRIDRTEDLQNELQKAYTAATTGRKGPVFLDISSSVLRGELDMAVLPVPQTPLAEEEAARISAEIAAKVRAAKRPVILIGSGVRQSGTAAWVQLLAEKFEIPVLSSRTTHDLLPDSPQYFGFVGSHGTRYGNFILSKADCILALGNRLAFPVGSKSFLPVVERAVTIRADIDKSEFLREVPGSLCYHISLETLLPELVKHDLSYLSSTHWTAVCQELKHSLDQWDKTPVVNALMQFIKAFDKETTFVCDVGNHSFWVTNACIYSGASNRTLYSGSFGTLGSALPKAIGACCGTGRPVVCFAGDQGLQMNIQELMFIAQHQLPIAIVVINNFASAMIREREEKQFSHFVHTTRESGYSIPDFQAIAHAYQLQYCCIKDTAVPANQTIFPAEWPCLIELQTDAATALRPNLPQGQPCQNLAPTLPAELYQQLDALE